MDGLTTKQAAARITRDFAPEGVTIAEWQVRRIFELGMLPEPPKFANKRVIAVGLLPAIVAAIRVRNWLPAEEVHQ